MFSGSLIMQTCTDVRGHKHRLGSVVTGPHFGGLFGFTAPERDLIKHMCSSIRSLNKSFM